jgi:small subunit ribosomal protein S15
MDPVLGDFKAEVVSAAVAAEARAARGAGGGASNAADRALLVNAQEGSKWDRSLLRKVVLDREAVWYSQPPQYDQNVVAEDDTTTTTFPLSNRPDRFAQGLTSETDLALLFKHLPEAGLARATYLEGSSSTTAQDLARRAAEETPAQAQSSEQLMRVLDLRNADSRGIRTMNVRRIVEVFGGPVEAATEGERLDTGSSAVQAAILTHRIRLLAEHIAQNPRDVHNRKNLRELVHRRAKVLRYMKKRVGRKGGEGESVYEALLDKIGVDRRAVEGEVVVK